MLIRFFGKRSCGKCVRGLVCSDCNIALGKFKDSANTLRNAIDYLARYAPSQLSEEAA